MEVETPPMAAEPPALLSTYRWRTAAPMGGGRQGPPGGCRWRWKRSYSHPGGGGHQDGAGKDTLVAAKATPRRSLFQRAFSVPPKGPKEARGPEGGRTTLQRYLWARRRGHLEGGDRRQLELQEGPPGSPPGAAPPALSPAPGDTVWDVAKVALVDGRLVLLGDEECPQAWGSSRSQDPTGDRRDPDPPAEDKPPQSGGSDTSPPAQPCSTKGLFWRRLWGRGVPRGVTEPKGGRGGQEPLGPPPGVAELDLVGDNVTVRPLDGSVVGGGFCFQVLTPGGSCTFGCSSLGERDRWLETLRRTARPNQDNCERLERSLTLCVFEARDLPPRRRLRCHLGLDGTLLARTTAKAAGPDGRLFWGELFHLAALPPSRALTLALCLDDPPAQPVASVTVPLAELGQPLERWWALGAGGAARGPWLRVRGRHREVRVLPIVRYKELGEFITFHYPELCARLEAKISLRHKEELAGAMVRVLQSTGKAKAFLIDLGVAELDCFDEREELLFRQNTLATKAIEEYMKLVGGKYLQDTLGEVVAQLCTSDESCEVDPSRCAGLDLVTNQQNLQQVCKETFQRIAASCPSFPLELGEIFGAWRAACAARGKAALGQRLVSASLFLRFLCPAIMSPSLFGLVQEYPGEATARTLTLVAKVIQNLANFTTFGEKEPYMGFMNEFLENNWSTMTGFLQDVANPESSTHTATYDGYVDLALELATLHLLLCDIFSTLDQATQEELEPLPTILRAIKEGTPVPVSVHLSSTKERSSPAETFKPGFVPPRALSKHSPLIKSQSLTSVRRGRAREDRMDLDMDLDPSLSPRSGRERRNVQRTQSVPARGKGSRGLGQQSSLEGPPAEDNPSATVPRDTPGRGRLRSSVPWQRPGAEVAVAQGRLDGAHQLEKALQARVAALERRERAGTREREQLREQLQRLQLLLEEGNAQVARLAARLSEAEGTRREELERLRSSEERSRELEGRLRALEQAALGGEAGPAQGPPSRTELREPPARGRNRSREDAQAAGV